jgi:hypothetical protein
MEALDKQKGKAILKENLLGTGATLQSAVTCILLIFL